MAGTAESKPQKRQREFVGGALLPRKERVRRSRIVGSLLGGAAGDALGAPVEFMTAADIRAQYGPRGVTALRTDTDSGKALITDDTQMTLFTAAGILAGEIHGGGEERLAAVAQAYRCWYATQTDERPQGAESWPRLWLNDVPELCHWRAPGTTALGVLGSGACGSMADPKNDSRGCGGVMRAAPLGLHVPMTGENEAELIREGAELAALTHGGAMGYMPAGLMTGILGRCVYLRRPEDTLEDAVMAALAAAESCFADEAEWPDLRALMARAVALGRSDQPDEACIAALGRGWHGHEALAIAVCCALRHEDDFSAAIIAAANHDGDSDSTAAITGQLLGAWHGLEAVGGQWTDQLELADLLAEVGRDLCLSIPVLQRRYRRGDEVKYRFVMG